MLLFNLSALGLDPAYEGRTSLLISSKSAKSWLYFDIFEMSWDEVNKEDSWEFDMDGGVAERETVDTNLRVFEGQNLSK